MSSLKKLAIRGAIWTLFSYGAIQGLRFGSNLVLTHLLDRKIFGLMALVNTFIMGLNLFSDIGIITSIIRSPRGDEPVFFNTAWTLETLRSGFVWLVCLAIAWPVAQFYGEPQLLWLIPIVGVCSLISGFNSTSIAILKRQIKLDKLTVFELSVYLVQLLVMVGWAWFSPTIWAIVVGGIISKLLELIWSYRLIPNLVNYFIWDKESVREILSFGRWTLLSTAMMFLALQADKLILGKFSLEFLGVYTIALTLAMVPREVSFALATKVMLPAVSTFAHLPMETFRAKIFPKRKLILMVGAVGLTLLSSFGDLLIWKLYDSGYSQAAWMLPILAVGLWPNILYATSHSILLSLGKPNL